MTLNVIFVFSGGRNSKQTQTTQSKSRLCNLTCWLDRTRHVRERRKIHFEIHLCTIAHVHRCLGVTGVPKLKTFL